MVHYHHQLGWSVDQNVVEKKKEVLLAAPLLARSYHNRYHHLFDLANFLQQIPILTPPPEVFVSPLKLKLGIHH